MSMFFFYIVEKKFLKSNVQTKIIVFRDSTLLKNKIIKKPFPFLLLGSAIIFYICYMISDSLIKDWIKTGYYSDIVFLFLINGFFFQKKIYSHHYLSISCNIILFPPCFLQKASYP